MDRVQKSEWVAATYKEFSESEILLIVHYKGLNVAEINDLRNNIREAKAKFKVAKNLLVKLAIKNTSFEVSSDLFKGPTACAYANEPVAIAKVIAEFAKKNDKLVIIGGVFGGNLLSQAEIEALSKLPSMDEIRAKIIAIINTPATRVAGVLQAPAGQLARVCGAYGASS